MDGQCGQKKLKRNDVKTVKGEEFIDVTSKLDSQIYMKTLLAEFF